MELIRPHTKEIMEGCKDVARRAGLPFQDETLEYIVTNRNLLELTPKLMIPTLYDSWVHDVEVLKEKGRYGLYPTNSYETVINPRPSISFCNDNNPDWMRETPDQGIHPQYPDWNRISLGRTSEALSEPALHLKERAGRQDRLYKMKSRRRR